MRFDVDEAEWMEVLPALESESGDTQGSLPQFAPPPPAGKVEPFPVVLNREGYSALPSPRSGHAMCSVGRLLFVHGGASLCLC